MHECSDSNPIGFIYNLLTPIKYSKYIRYYDKYFFLICSRNLIDQKKIFKGLLSFTYFFCVNLRETL